MALPIAATERKLEHRRRIDVQVFSRGDRRWEVDARIDDARSEAIELVTGPHAAGKPIHDMLLRLVVDEHLDILEAGAETRAMPYPDHCGAYGDAYSRLVGLNLLRGFRQAVRERLGGAQACTHITELAQVLPTAVVQALAGEVLDTRGDSPTSPKPFQIDRCHALRAEGEVVRTFYPRWYRPSAAPITDPEASERARTP